MKFLFSIILIVCSSSILLAQEDLKAIKQVGAGYPAAARAVRAHGEVLIEVNIGKEGKVIDAKAYLGHPLLRAASETAAKLWLFTPSQDGPEVRTTILSFRFSPGGDIRYVAESEKDEETLATHVFPHTFAAETTWETIIPRLLLLERQNGIIRPEKCPLHKIEMSVEIQNRKCDPLEPENPFQRSETYNAAEDELFPKANVVLGCYNRGIEREEVRYCSTCRTARANWLANEK